MSPNIACLSAGQNLETGHWSANGDKTMERQMSTRETRGPGLDGGDGGNGEKGMHFSNVQAMDWIGGR